jgi:hypothetical protein
MQDSFHTFMNARLYFKPLKIVKMKLMYHRIICATVLSGKIVFLEFFNKS